MKLGIVLNSNDSETAWNAFRLGREALGQNHQVRIFLLGKGVELQDLGSEPLDGPRAVKAFLEGGGEILACGTCLKLRGQESHLCPVSTMAELVGIIEDSDRVVSLG